MKRRGKIRLVPCKIDVQPAPAFHQRGSFFCLRLCGESGGIVSLFLEPKAGESHLIRSEEDVAEWGVVVLYECHGDTSWLSWDGTLRLHYSAGAAIILSRCFPGFSNFLFTNIHAKCILVTSLILNKDKERKRVNRFSGRELPHGERQQRVLTKSSASPVSE